MKKKEVVWLVSGGTAALLWWNIFIAKEKGSGRRVEFSGMTEDEEEEGWLGKGGGGKWCAHL